MQGISYYIILGFIVITLLVSLFKKHNAYESFIKGAKESMKMGISLFPYLLIMIVSVESFKASRLLNDLFKELPIPEDLILQGIFRPISSHASLSLMLQIFKEYGVDSNVSFVSSILQGGNDTTIYVMSLYFGVCGIKKTHHAYIVGIICDIICFILCVILFFILI